MRSCHCHCSVAAQAGNETNTTVLVIDLQPECHLTVRTNSSSDLQIPAQDWHWHAKSKRQTSQSFRIGVPPFNSRKLAFYDLSSNYGYLLHGSLDYALHYYYSGSRQDRYSASGFPPRLRVTQANLPALSVEIGSIRSAFTLLVPPPRTSGRHGIPPFLTCMKRNALRPTLLRAYRHHQGLYPGSMLPGSRISMPPYKASDSNYFPEAIEPVITAQEMEDWVNPTFTLTTLKPSSHLDRGANG